MNAAMSCNSAIPDKEPKLTVGADHTRHKRRRRGKKRKFQRSDKSVNECDINESNENQISDILENQALEKDMSNNTKRRPRGILIRPIDVPKAPKNSTQFIIDDHKGCGLYFSFETPNPYYKGEYIGARTDTVQLCETAVDAAFHDIDYKYETPQNFYESSFSTQDFEDVYNTSRYEELMLLSKKDLLQTVASLETRLEELEEDLVKYDPSTVIEQLQHKLLSLQEENAILTGLNSSLKQMFTVESNESASEQSLEEELSENEETECILDVKEAYAGNVESMSEPSVDGNPENQDFLLCAEPSEEQNMSCVEKSSERSVECSSSDTEKIEYNSMSEKMSNVEIAESVSEHVNL